MHAATMAERLSSGTAPQRQDLPAEIPDKSQSKLQTLNAAAQEKTNSCLNYFRQLTNCAGKTRILFTELNCGCNQSPFTYTNFRRKAGPTQFFCKYRLFRSGNKARCSHDPLNNIQIETQMQSGWQARTQATALILEAGELSAK
jgi:hypothetical protein